MKNLFKALVATLALNFLVLAGGVGWLWKSGKLDRKAVLAIKEIVFSKASDGAATTQPATTEPTTKPYSPLEELLARHAGTMGAAQQVEMVQQAVDARMGQLDQRQRQLEDLQRLVNEAQSKLRNDRTALVADRQQLSAQQQETARLAGDQGFQDTLNLYNSMTPKQVKSIFANMDDFTMARYLQAMTPRTAAKIAKEFKTPDELERFRRVMDKIRQGPLPDPTTQPVVATPKDEQPQ